ncbi:MAG: beta-galactosidase [Candidatus Omnitrophica bacterium]|nr:beta-galactosidase [Candidatus Omnitrophota bacterium]
MPKVEIRNNQIVVGPKKIPLLSGEVHYWRLHPDAWEEILTQVKGLGLKIVSTYIPWDYHEPRRGQFDFTGQTDPKRNLVAFLDLTRRMGFWVVIRPGPYIYSEWPREGVPAYAYRYHRLHPQFLKFAGNYLKKVVKVLSPYFATRSRGHILLLQADNEIDPWPDVFGAQYGLAGKPGLFQGFLKKLYAGRIKDLNERWGTHYKRFEEAGAFLATMLNRSEGFQLKGDHELQRHLDYFRFKYSYSRQCAEWNVQAYRKLGVDIPIYLNVYPFFYAHDWSDMQEVSDLVGVDLYPSNEFGEDKFEQRKFIDKVRFLKNTSRLPFIAEFESGIWHSRHYESGVLTPNHYRLLGLSAILGGVAGWNWYMLVNRDNWYMSPINEWGRVRPELYEAFGQMVKVAEKMYLPELKKVCDIGVTLNPLQYAARTLSHDSPVLTALYDADVDYELLDPRKGLPDKKCLFYSGNQWLAPKAQENLRRYVERGGVLVAFRDYPRKDECFIPRSIVGFEEPQSVLFEFKRKFKVCLSKKRSGVEIISSVYCFRNVSGNPVQADLGSYGRKTIGYKKKIGKGYLLHLGVDPTPSLIEEVLSFLGVLRPSRSVTRDIKTAWFERGKFSYLVAVNNGDEDKSASVYLPGLEQSVSNVKIEDILAGKAEKILWEKGKPFVFEIPRKDGKVFQFARA